MEASEILSKYQSIGISFRIYGPDLKLKIPEGVKLSDDELAELKANKAGIIQTLTSCPARDRNSNNCYGTPWFDAKSTSEKLRCDPGACRWKDRREELIIGVRGY